MMRRTSFWCVTWLILATGTAHADAEADFAQWVTAFKARAITQGIRPTVFDNAFSSVTLDEEVIDLDQKQPENKITLEKYLSNTINDRRIRLGREMMVEHRAELKQIAEHYHVPAKYIVALWGIESDYGTHQGDFSVVQSLATLAFEGRRRDFFSDELIAALRIINDEHMDPYELTGSWAGAMGGCQFMPSTYLKYAVDADGNGHRDIWQSPPDVFASIANYLHALGWSDAYSWGSPVTVPTDFDESDADIAAAKPFAVWQKRGLVAEHASKIQNAPNLYAIYPGKPEEGALLVTDNYKAILQWNRSRYFATAVVTLADKLGE